jgi:hypothetical protein
LERRKAKAKKKNVIPEAPHLLAMFLRPEKHVELKDHKIILFRMIDPKKDFLPGNKIAFRKIKGFDGFLNFSPRERSFSENYLFAEKLDSPYKIRFYSKIPGNSVSLTENAGPVTNFRRRSGIS